MDKKCSTCKYRSDRTSLNYCDYIGHRGRSRGCRADENCDKYEPRRRKIKVNDGKGGAVKI